MGVIEQDGTSGVSKGGEAKSEIVQIVSAEELFTLSDRLAAQAEENIRKEDKTSKYLDWVLERLETRSIAWHEAEKAIPLGERTIEDRERIKELEDKYTATLTEKRSLIERYARPLREAYITGLVTNVITHVPASSSGYQYSSSNASGWDQSVETAIRSHVVTELGVAEGSGGMQVVNGIQLKVHVTSAVRRVLPKTPGWTAELIVAHLHRQGQGSIASPNEIGTVHMTQIPGQTDYSSVLKIQPRV